MKLPALPVADPLATLNFERLATTLTTDEANVVALQAAVAALQTPLVTVLTPGVGGIPNPVTDGFTVNLLADATNGVVWTLRYRSASASAYKWEFIGGPPMVARVDTNESTSSTTYANLATNGPDVTIPAVAGDFDIEFGAEGYIGATATQTAYMSVSINASTPTDADAIPLIQSNGVNISAGAGGGRHVRKTASVASSLIRCQYRLAAAGTNFYNSRWLKVTPVRVG